MKIGDPLDRSTDHGPQNHKYVTLFIVECIYRLVMISIDLSETTQKKRTGNLRQRLRQNFFLTIFFPDQKIFFLDFVLD